MLVGPAPISIGADVVVGPNTTLTTSWGPRRGDSPIHVAAGVWIGADVLIFPGVTIGRNAVIQMGARVVCDVPAGATVTGAPARIIQSN